MDEILRVVKALQTADEHGVATPADWQPEDKVIVKPPRTQQEAKEREENPEYEVTDWYFSKKKFIERKNIKSKAAAFRQLCFLFVVKM
jgi:peroxiredoxin 2/4